MPWRVRFQGRCAPCLSLTTKGEGKSLAEGRLEKEEKINDYILSSTQENGKNKKSSAVVTSLIAHQQQITKTQLDTSSSLISAYTQCSTYVFYPSIWPSI
jgi:hypothetical protein